jgi:hypothetical protein
MFYRNLKGYKYELSEMEMFDTGIRIPAEIQTQYIWMTISGYLTIKAGYAWDGPSGPTIDTKNFMRGSLAHDALYQLMRMGLLGKDQRGAADGLLRRLCREDGMSAIRAAWVFSAVRVFGRFSTNPDPKDTEGIQIAP